MITHFWFRIFKQVKSFHIDCLASCIIFYDSSVLRQLIVLPNYKPLLPNWVGRNSFILVNLGTISFTHFVGFQPSVRFVLLLLLNLLDLPWKCFEGYVSYWCSSWNGFLLATLFCWQNYHKPKFNLSLQAVKKGDTIFIGQYLFTGSETTSVWLEVRLHLKDEFNICLINIQLFFGRDKGLDQLS